LFQTDELGDDRGQSALRDRDRDRDRPQAWPKNGETRAAEYGDLEERQ
jgi:hypothetical protein